MVQRIFKFCLVAVLLAQPLPVFGAMSSANYTIYSDSIGLGGGGVTNTATYQISDTFADQIAGTISGATYELRGGFQSQEKGDLSISLSSNSVALGSLDPSRVNSANVNVIITSNARTGYTLSVGSVSGSMPPAVVGGAVTAGTLNYGFAASGPHSAIVGDVPVQAGQVIASSPVEVDNEITTLTFKASMKEGSSGGDYSQNLTLSAVANF